MITVSILAATICFNSACFPVLIGDKTPIGTFSVNQRYTKDPGYGGDVLQFYEDSKKVYAIHRLWLLRPSEHRAARILSENSKQHTITHGCINVEPEVYDKLVNCCLTDKLEIRK